MTLIRHATGDMPFDSFDLAYYITDETPGHLVIQNRVPGGANLPLTSQASGTDFVRSEGFIQSGPFGGISVSNNARVLGYYGANNALDCPNTVHISFCIYTYHFTAPFPGTSSNLGFVGRTRVTPATALTALDTTNFAIALTGLQDGTSYGNGDNVDYFHQMAASVNVAGTLRQANVSSPFTDNDAYQHTLHPNRWHLVDVVRDNATGIIQLYTDGLSRSSASFAGSIQGTGNGYWFIGMPFSGGTVIPGFSARYARVRIMNTNRGPDWIKERYRRMMASL